MSDKRSGRTTALFDDAAFAEDLRRASLPPPDGKFGMVSRIERRDGKLRLVYAAFGVRQHPRGSNAPTVYQIAHDRLQN